MINVLTAEKQTFHKLTDDAGCIIFLPLTYLTPMPLTVLLNTLKKMSGGNSLPPNLPK